MEQTSLETKVEASRRSTSRAPVGDPPGTACAHGRESRGRAAPPASAGAVAAPRGELPAGAEEQPARGVGGRTWVRRQHLPLRGLMQQPYFNLEQNSRRAGSNLLSSGRGGRIYEPTCLAVKCPLGKWLVGLRSAPCLAAAARGWAALCRGCQRGEGGGKGQEEYR